MGHIKKNIIVNNLVVHLLQIFNFRSFFYIYMTWLNLAKNSLLLGACLSQQHSLLKKLSLFAAEREININIILSN